MIGCFKCKSQLTVLSEWQCLMTVNVVPHSSCCLRVNDLLLHIFFPVTLQKREIKDVSADPKNKDRNTSFRLRSIQIDSHFVSEESLNCGLSYRSCIPPDWPRISRHRGPLSPIYRQSVRDKLMKHDSVIDFHLKAVVRYTTKWLESFATPLHKNQPALWSSHQY